MILFYDKCLWFVQVTLIIDFLTDGIVNDVLKVYLVKCGKQWDGREAQGIVGKTPSEAAAVIVDNYGLSITADELMTEITPMFSDQYSFAL